MIDVTSNYPTSIDPLMYCSDISIAQSETISEYEQYIAAGNYEDAYDLLENTNIFGWFADYLNMLENRIYTLQTYLLEGGIGHSEQCLYSNSEPVIYEDRIETRSLAENDIWVTNIV